MTSTRRLGGAGVRAGRLMPKWVWTGTRAGVALILVVVIAGNGLVRAQAPSLPASAVVAAAAVETDASSVRLLVGRSAVLDVGTAIARVSLTSADVADALVTSPNQLLINGKMPGTISMFVWDRAGALRRYEVVVQRDLATLSEQMRQLFPSDRIEVQSNGRNVVLTGSVSSKDAIERAVSVAAGYVDKREEVVTLLQLQAGAPSNQVLLRVRFAEVSRSALTELGGSFFTSPLGVKNTIGRVTTQQFSAPGFEDLKYTKEGTADSNWSDFGHPVKTAEGKFTFSDFLNVFLFNEKFDLGAMLKVLQTKGLFQSLAEPNLVAESGKEASFLAGGEFPIPVAQGSGANIGVSVVFKEFGIRLTFTPTVDGNRVHLKVRPEVSTLDFANAVTLGGFRIPALTTRRTETELTLENGQTFAIAGLMNNSLTSTLNKIPGIGDIPILGYLFKSKAAQKNQTELVVMITPEILPNGSRGLTPSLPRIPEPFLPPLPQRESIELPPPAFGGRPSSEQPVAAIPAPAPTPASPVAAQPSAATAAAAVSALTPSAPRMSDPAAPSPSANVTAPAAPVPAATRPLTEQEQKVVERARREDQEKAKEHAKAQARANALEEKRLAEQAVEARRQAATERERQERLAKEQAKRDAEAARRSQEAARKQGERDRERQEVINRAAARLKAAEAVYNAEVAKTGNP